jgi:hypothetical protein
MLSNSKGRSFIRSFIHPLTTKKGHPLRDALHCSSYSTKLIQSPRLNLDQLMHLGFQLGEQLVVALGTSHFNAVLN